MSEPPMTHKTVPRSPTPEMVEAAAGGYWESVAGKLRERLDMYESSHTTLRGSIVACANELLASKPIADWTVDEALIAGFHAGTVRAADALEALRAIVDTDFTYFNDVVGLTLTRSQVLAARAALARAGS